MKRKLNAINWIKEYLENHIQSGSLCIDATAGRGNDTVFLCEQVGEQGRVLAFDIQEEAVCSTRALLEEKGLSSRAQVILDSHVHMDGYVSEETVDCIMFNLGYLPGAKHHIATKPSVTIEAIEKGLGLLKKGGMISLCIYHGGDSGFEERDCVFAYLEGLDQNQYTVLRCEFYNRSNHPPIPVFILKE
jgi:predicted methyltransferase